MTDDYQRFVTFTIGRKFVAMASFGKAEAEAALALLEQDEAARKECGIQLQRTVAHAVRTVGLRGRINVTPKNRNGTLIVGKCYQIPLRVARFLAEVLLHAPSDDGLESLKLTLLRISQGVAPPQGETLSPDHPFLLAEGFRPKKTADPAIVLPNCIRE